MHKRTTPKIFKRAKELRREMTPQERRLHTHLRAHRTGNVHFRPQHAIGNYIADFCAPRRKLIVELDGSQHLEQGEYDTERTAYFESKGYRVLRFWNNDVSNNLESVLTVIWDTLKEQKAKNSKAGKRSGIDRENRS
jgi:very-short-patch-repair endonuclease